MHNYQQNVNIIDYCGGILVCLSGLDGFSDGIRESWGQILLDTKIGIASLDKHFFVGLLILDRIVSLLLLLVS